MNLTWTQARRDLPAILCGPAFAALRHGKAGEQIVRPECSVEGCHRHATRLCDFPVEFALSGAAQVGRLPCNRTAIDEGSLGKSEPALRLGGRAETVKPRRCLAPLCEGHCGEDRPHLCPAHREVWTGAWKNARDVVMQMARRDY